MPVLCSICADPDRRERIERFLAEGRGTVFIEQWSRTPEAKEVGFRVIKAETVARHLKTCLSAERVSGILVAPVLNQLPRVRELPKRTTPDVASIIVEQAAVKLAAGDMRITAQHALTAQAQIDRREEKQKDRELQAAIAVILTGRVPPSRYVRDVSPPPDDQ